MAIGPITLFKVSFCLIYIIQLSNFHVSSLGQLIVSKQEDPIADKGAQSKAVVFSMLQHLNHFLNLTIPALVRMDITDQRFVVSKKYNNIKIGLYQIFRNLAVCYLESCTIPSRITPLQELFNQKKSKISFWLQLNQACMRCWSDFQFLFASSSNALEKRKLKGKHTD